MKKTKKSQFFLIDGIFAIVILIIGFMLISSPHKKNEQFVSVESVANNIMEIFSSVRGDELCDGNICSNNVLEDLYLNGDIKNINQTLMDIIGELYSRNQKQKAKELFEKVTIINNLFRKDLFGLELKINDESIYSFGTNKDKAEELISMEKIIFGFYEIKEEGNVIFWGPYLAEVNVWNEK